MTQSIRSFLRHKSRRFLLRILREPAFAIAVCAAIIGSSSIYATHEPAVPNVLDGTAVITIDGILAGDHAGHSVAGGGDINGDGIDDIVIGAPGAGTDGETYVVFGSANPGNIDLADIKAGNGGGFVILGAATSNSFDQSGHSVSIAGDVNNDNKDDIIIGAHKADVGAVGAAGKTYVVFGVDSTASIDLTDIDADTGGHGFVINGVAAGDNVGYSVSGAGNINGDAFDDLIVGAPYADVPGYSNSGRSYVVFGKSTTTPISLSALESGTPTGGFVINGFEASLFSGWSVSGAGNVNGDSFDDLLIGAPYANGNYGEAYVVFGKSSTDAVDLDLDVLQGSLGFAMNRNVGTDLLGRSVSGAGDVNGDGMDDIIVGAPNADGYGGANVGYSFLVIGRIATSTIDLDSLEINSEGFSIEGVGVSDHSGFSVSGAGDLDGDGLDDVIVGSYLGSSDIPTGAGKAHVVFGKSTFAPVLLSDVDNEVGGFVASGVAGYDNLGTSVSSAGDFNGDGLDDVVIGAPLVAQGAEAYAGQSYVLFNPGVPQSLVIELRDADTGDAIPHGVLVAEWDNVPCGFPVLISSIDAQWRAIYSSGRTKIVDYNLRAVAPGYKPGDAIIVRPDSSGNPVAIIELTKDIGLTESNIVRVQIDMLDDLDVLTGEQLVSSSLMLRQGGFDVEIPAIFGVGEMIFHGVPSGTFEVFHANTAEHEFTATSVTVGTGEDKKVTITSTLVPPPSILRASLPGNVIGTVSNTGGPTPVLLPDALVYSIQTGTNISTITKSASNGSYFFPSVVEGQGTLQAFSENGVTEGTIKPTLIVTNQTFGDDDSEESDLGITFNAGKDIADSDFDGLTDEFESTFLGGAPVNERGANDDPDGDGLTNLEEQNANTHPMLVDTDSDAFEDGIELNWGSDPTLIGSIPTPPDPIWVDFGYDGILKAGTLGKPFSTIVAAVNAAPDGTTIRIKGDVSTVIGENQDTSISKPLTLEGFRGSIIIR